MLFFLAEVRSSSRPSSKTALTNMGSGSMGEWRDASMGKAHCSPPIRAKKSEVFLVLEGLMQIAVVPEDEDLRILFRRGTQPLPPALRAIQKHEKVPLKVGRVYYRGADRQVRTSSSSRCILRLCKVLCL